MSNLKEKEEQLQNASKKLDSIMKKREETGEEPSDEMFEEILKDAGEILGDAAGELFTSFFSTEGSAVNASKAQKLRDKAVDGKLAQVYKAIETEAANGKSSARVTGELTEDMTMRLDHLGFDVLHDDDTDFFDINW